MNTLNPTTGDNRLQFATAFYHADGQSPNAWTVSQSAKLAMYYRCMVVCYASIRRLYPTAQLVLYSNAQLPYTYAQQLQQLGVVITLLAGEYVSDKAFHNHFPGCLFTLDVLNHVAGQRQSFDYLILLDNDCILRHRLAALSGDNLYAYVPGYEVDTVANGQSRATLTLAISQMQNTMPQQPPIAMLGGEFYAIPVCRLNQINDNIGKFWQWMKTSGQQTYGNQLTEEHVMSAALAIDSQGYLTDTDIIKRIWTTEHFSTVDGSEAALAIWHLPSEKKKGLERLYRHWQKRGFAGLDDAEFTALTDNLIKLKIKQPRSKLFTLAWRLRNALKYVLIGRL